MLDGRIRYQARPDMARLDYVDNPESIFCIDETVVVPGEDALENWARYAFAFDVIQDLPNFATLRALERLVTR
jgi:hypothetical protein